MIPHIYDIDIIYDNFLILFDYLYLNNRKKNFVFEVFNIIIKWKQNERGKYHNNNNNIFQ